MSRWVRHGLAAVGVSVLAWTVAMVVVLADAWAKMARSDL